ncbi:hypothetical protein [Blastococcus mobilis]|uniref:Uncharacterized protein n=1 Tax=Blastococcus mobilis TaxID=1938746 RepID=A0A238V8Y1_9ACTN|nr:hypothetical protein [Blastococcus mobilis]SNR30902.1 hypothetical protein SAMN06272737_102249 [Blastococcus mobilis]
MLPSGDAERSRFFVTLGVWGFVYYFLVGPSIWFVRTSNALDDYWQSLGARGTTLV